MLPFVRMLEYGNIKPKPAEVVEIYGQYTHAAIKMSTGTYYIRGTGTKGQLGYGNYVNNLTSWRKITPPASDTNPILGIYLGYEISYMWTSQALYVCGSMRSMGMGTSYNLPSWSTYGLPSGYSTSDIKKINASQDDTYVLMNNGDLLAIGMNSYGEFGNGTLTASSSFIRVNTNVKDIFVCGAKASAWLIKNDNTVWRSGYGLNGELVNGSKTNIRTWTQLVLPSGKTIKDFSTQGFCIVMLLTDTSTSNIEFWFGGFMRYGNAGNGATGAYMTLTQNTNVSMIGVMDSFFVSKAQTDSLTIIKNSTGSLFYAGNNVFRPMGESPDGLSTFTGVLGLPSLPSTGGAINYFDGLMVCNGKLYHSGTQKTIYSNAESFWTEDTTVPTE